MPKSSYESKEDRSGKLSEHFIFGDITTGKNSLRYGEALKKYVARNRGKGNPAYLPFKDALELVAEAQGGDPSQPQKRFMRDVREAIIKMMGLTDEEARAIGIYSAVGTPLDVYHGVDAFIQWRQKIGAPKIVTMDATINPEKIIEDRKKADVLIGELPDPFEHEKEYLAFVQHIARQLTTHLQAMPQ